MGSIVYRMKKYCMGKIFSGVLGGWSQVQVYTLCIQTDIRCSARFNKYYSNINKNIENMAVNANLGTENVNRNPKYIMDHCFP